jgi:hypothetical protein
MQAKGQAVRSDALARYGVQIGQKLRHVDYTASGLGKFFAGVLSCLTVSDWRRDRASNPPLPARGAQTGTASGRQGRSREAGARQRLPVCRTCPTAWG